MEKVKATKVESAKFPNTPGVYLFEDKKSEIIYVGKASNLKSRISSYFGKGLESKTLKMVSAAKNMAYIEVSSELEAILLEASLIKKYRPKYNIQLKDDKSPIYIVITKEEYPRVITARKSNLQKEPVLEYFGPFTQARTARKVLKLVRKVFPFAQHRVGKRGCLYSQIGLCDPCPSVIDKIKDPSEKKKAKSRYKATIASVRKTLRGDLFVVRQRLEKEMKMHSKIENFEEAGKVAAQINMMDFITQSNIKPSLYLKNPNLLEDIRQKELTSMRKELSPYCDIQKLERIECFDIAHLSGTHPTASMVTFIKGEPDKTYYRHFSIRSKNKRSDVHMMAEVLERRKERFGDWGVPDLIIVDGGKPQLSAARKVVGNNICIIGLAKRYETLVIASDDGYHELRLKRGPALNLVQRLRNEAHRFARRYHHKLVSKSIRT